MEFVSQVGYDKLVAELNEMIEVELPRAIDAVSEARDKGDLSENFEYHAAKREQNRLLGRIKYKQNVLAHCRVITADASKADCVQLLSKVTVTNTKTNAHMTFTIVSPHEANIKEGKISVKSPIAQALMNKRQGDLVNIRIPAGMIPVKIDEVKI